MLITNIITFQKIPLTSIGLIDFLQCLNYGVGDWYRQVIEHAAHEHILILQLVTYLHWLYRFFAKFKPGTGIWHMGESEHADYDCNKCS